MKSKILLFFLALSLLTNCKKIEGEYGVFEFQGRGKILKAGPSVYQYGTHIILVDNVRYALKSDNINLNDYNQKYVTIWGNKVQNYPVELGPVYINVRRIRK